MSCSFAAFDPSVSKEFWYYSSASYCAKANILSWKVGKVRDLYPEVTDIRVYENKFTDNLGYLAYNEAKNTIFLVFRGTMDTSAMNWVAQNFNFPKTEYPSNECHQCKVHRGFYQAYKNLGVSEMMKDLKDLKSKYPEAKLVVSGHSLGGAMAYFGFLDACDKVGKVDLLITYGAPRVGDSEFANYFKNKNCGGEKFRVVYKKDPVPHVPPSVMGFSHGFSEIYYENNFDSYTYCVDVEDEKCSKKYDFTSLNVLDHVAYHDFNQQLLMASCILP